MTITNLPELTEDALLGIDLAIGHFDRMVNQAEANGGDKDNETFAGTLLRLRAAQTWVMKVQHAILVSEDHRP